MHPEQGRVRSLPFVVRAAPGSEAPIAVQVPVNTWEAYNNWGGKSLYDFNSSDGVRASHLSFDRPLASQPMFAYEYPLVRYLERRGFNVDYLTDADIDRAPAALAERQLVIVAGHGEYWTKAIRDGFEAAQAAGTNLAFMGANIAYWQVRYEDSRQTLVGYKSFADPEPDLELTTVRWRDLATPRPECELLGVQYMGGIDTSDTGRAYEVTAAADDPWFAGSGLTPGTLLPDLVGYEWDRIVPGCLDREVTSLLRYSGSPSNADAIRYTAASGARVFSGGSMRYSWGLDNRAAWWAVPDHSSPGLQRMTANALDDLGIGGIRPDPDPPGTFALLEPSSGWVAQASPSEFRWERTFDAVSRVVRYELRVDGVLAATLAAEECATGSCSWRPTTGWPEGAHEWTVTAVDAAGLSRTTSSRTFTVDTTPPDTTIASGPSGWSRSSAASFTFSAETGSTFECRLDAAGWESCSSPMDYTSLADGEHVFRVRATDAAGNAEATEAARAFTMRES